MWKNINKSRKKVRRQQKRGREINEEEKRQ
jgi:hypothetical protein